MNYPKIRKLSQIGYIVFSFAILITLFLPCVSLDRYTEYDFNYGYYNTDYQGNTTPIATKITPADFISALFGDRSDAGIAQAKYNKTKQELTIKLDNGELTQEEYNKKLASSRSTSKYYAFALRFGTESSLSRLQDRMFLHSVILLVFYVVSLIMFIVNLINLLKPKRILSIANMFVGWIEAVIYLIFAIFTFSLVLTSSSSIEGFSGSIKEEITTCLSPTTLGFIIFFALIAYSIIVTFFEQKDRKLEKQNREIPVLISQSIKPKNRYRKINSKKSKYKNGTKKKLRR